MDCVDACTLQNARTISGKLCPFSEAAFSRFNTKSRKGNFSGVTGEPGHLHVHDLSLLVYLHPVV